MNLGPVKIEMVTQAYMMKKAINNDRKFDIFHPSAWGGCLRSVAYQYYNHHEPFVIKRKEKIDIRIERIFDNGHGIHARWQNYLDKSGVLKGCWKCVNPNCGLVYGDKELLGIFNPQRTNPDWQCACGNKDKLEYVELRVKSEDVYNFDGHCDAVVDLTGTPFARGDNMDVMVVDFKSMKDEYFGEITESKAKHEHVIQVNIYMWILGLHAAVVLYENKNTQAIKEVFVPRDEALIEKIKEQAIWLQNVLKKGKLPNRPDGYSPSKVPCRFCEFISYCWR